MRQEHLLNLLMAAHDDYTGSICYDDTELSQIKSESLYNMVSAVQQNVFIFNASIRDNITMFSYFPEEEVNRAIELSGLSGLIAGRARIICAAKTAAVFRAEKSKGSLLREAC